MRRRFRRFEYLIYCVGCAYSMSRSNLTIFLNLQEHQARIPCRNRTGRLPKLVTVQSPSGTEFEWSILEDQAIYQVFTRVIRVNNLDLSRRLSIFPRPRRVTAKFRAARGTERLPKINGSAREMVRVISAFSLAQAFTPGLVRSARSRRNPVSQAPSRGPFTIVFLSQP
jgi:hypothetical protein